MGNRSFPGLRLQGEDDTLFKRACYPELFHFNEQVARVFDDMVSRSVPFYEESIRMLIVWLEGVADLSGPIVDLGCSTGTVLHAVSVCFPETRLNLIGIDQSQAMIDRAREKLVDRPANHSVELVCGDVTSHRLPTCTVVIINYTLQFLSIRDRSELLREVFRALEPGGVVCISEKMRVTDPRFEETMVRQHEDYRFEKGYGQDEIERKKSATERMMLPTTYEWYQEEMIRIGFTKPEIRFKWNNFASFVASK